MGVKTAKTRLMAKKKPDAVETDPPEEARPDTTTTPLLVENGKMSPDVEFTPKELLKVFEYITVHVPC